MAKRNNNKSKTYEDEFTQKDLTRNVLTNRIPLKYKNPKQKEFVKTIVDSEITICAGPAGTGKSFLAVAKALDLIQQAGTKYEKILLTRPAVESGSKLGYLPGDLSEKLFPYMLPLLDIIDKVVGKEKRLDLMKHEIVEFQPLSFIRGKTIDNAILIMDECQNASPHEMKTLLTRIGENSKFILTGDLDQSDKYPKLEDTGLYDITHRLKGVNGLNMFEFNEADIVRNPIISEILKKYK